MPRIVRLGISAVIVGLVAFGSLHAEVLPTVSGINLGSFLLPMGVGAVFYLNVPMRRQ